jgi:hypothetical protein
MSPRVPGDVLGVQRPLRDEPLHDGVVGRDPLERGVAEPVAARVADVRQGEPFPVGEDGGQRGGHPGARGVLADAEPQLLAREPHRGGEQVDRGHGGLTQDAGRDDVRGGRRGDLTRCRSPDAVGHQHAGGVQERRVLVVAAHASHVADPDTGKP